MTTLPNIANDKLRKLWAEQYRDIGVSTGNGLSAGSSLISEPDENGRRDLFLYGPVVDAMTADLYRWFFGDDLDLIVSDEIRSALDDVEGPLRIRLNTPGGNVIETAVIRSIFQDYSSKSGNDIETKIDGLAASAGSILMLSGSPVAITDFGSVFIHKSISYYDQYGRGNADQIRAAGEELFGLANNVDSFDRAMIPIYANKTGQAPTRILDWMKAETLFNAADAKKFGFVDKIL